jgi:hypothetical protein
VKHVTTVLGAGGAELFAIEESKQDSRSCPTAQPAQELKQDRDAGGVAQGSWTSGSRVIVRHDEKRPTYFPKLHDDICT